MIYIYIHNISGLDYKHKTSLPKQRKRYTNGDWEATKRWEARKKMESPPRFELIDVSSPAGSFSTDLPLLLHSMCSSSCCCCHCCLLYGLPWSLAHRYMTYPALVSLVAFELTIFACLQAKGKKGGGKRGNEKMKNWSQAQLSPFPCLFISFCFGFLYHKLYTSGSFCFFGCCCCCRLRVRSLSARCAHILLIVLFMMLLLQELLLLLLPLLLLLLSVVQPAAALAKRSYCPNRDTSLS